MTLKVDLDRVRGDGHDFVITPEIVDETRRDLIDLQGRFKEEFKAFSDMQNVRRCRWAGQSPDGRKREEYLGKEATPFEGASDARIPLADTIITERVDEYMTAVERVLPTISGIGGSDWQFANQAAKLLRYVIRNCWGRQFWSWLEIIANYMEGDDPAGCLAYVYWHRETALRYEEITGYDILDILIEQMRGSIQNEEELNDLFDVVENPEREEDLKMIVSTIHPNLKAARVSKMVRELYANGTTSFPVPYLRVNEPRMRPLRFNVDVFVPSNVTDLQRSRVYFLEYLTKAEVLERQRTEKWSKEFVESLIGKQDETGQVGMSFLHDYTTINVNFLKDKYEIIRCFRYAANDDGVPGVYRITFSAFVAERAARDAELLRDQHGLMPFVDFMREHLSDSLLDSRSVQELSSTQQNSLKLLSDSYEDHVQKSVNPPILAPKGSPRLRMNITPHGQIDVVTRTPPEYLKGPEYPRAADTHEKNVRRLVNEYFGRSDDGVDPAIVVIRRQKRVSNYLHSLADVFRIVFQLCMQYMPTEEIVRIVGGDLPIKRTANEIRGLFDLEIDVRDFDLDTLMQKAETVLKYVRPFDKDATIQQNVIAQSILQRVDSHWAGAIDDVQTASERERREALDEFSQMLNGIEPPLKEGGVNSQLRMQIIQEEVDKRASNPQMFGPISPAAGAIIQNYMKNMQFIQMQQTNAETGRFGTQPVFGQQGGNAA